MSSLIKLDQTLSAHLSNFTAQHAFYKNSMIGFGEWGIYLIPIVLVVVWFTRSKNNALLALYTGVLAIGINLAISHLVNRTRPALAQIGAQELVFHRPDASFPSDHAALLMAVALSFLLNGELGYGWATFILALIVGFARVAIGVHYPGDILGGFLVAAIATMAIEAFKKPVQNVINNPVIKLLSRIGL